MKAGSRRALVGVLSIAAVLLPAAGIAYLGAVSYREERGLVAARLDEQARAAQQVAAAVEDEIAHALDRVADTLASGNPAAREALRRDLPLAAFPFHLSGGKLRFPAEEPLRAPPSGDDLLLSRAPGLCPERGFDTCAQVARAAARRAGQLASARSKELLCGAREDPCGPGARPLIEARRAYANLARYEDTGPEAVLGLARIAQRIGDTGEAIKQYKALDKRFGARYDADGVSYRLLAELGTAEAAGEPEALLGVYRRLLARSFRAPSRILDLVAERLGAAVSALSTTPAQQSELGALNRRLSDVRAEARFAAAIAAEVDEMARAAGAQARGRPALAAAHRTLIYRRAPSGDVFGLVVDEAMLERVAAGVDVAIDDLAPGARTIVERLGARSDDTLRTLARTGFGPVLPHLSLAIANPRALPDPLDEIIESRGRRHMAITGGLVALLLIGILATVRGAARERELARLKSDFVSTVSHELKTPLTSIRMFAEMLEQGVAGDDSERQARYQRIIVSESERLGLLIANLLDYAQIERGTRRYDRRPARPGDLVRDAVETFRRFRDGDGHEIRVVLDPAAADDELLIDREVVIQALLNLLANAAKYGGAEHPIDVSVRRRPGHLLALEVRDRGPGIPAAEQSRVFREFYRTPAAYTSGVEGTGLGLALVKRHVEAQGGRVELESAEGRGATFSIIFPVLDDESSEPRRASP
jgi:signal transduction histidine kinase